MTRMAAMAPPPPRLPLSTTTVSRPIGRSSIARTPLLRGENANHQGPVPAPARSGFAPAAPDDENDADQREREEDPRQEGDAGLMARSRNGPDPVSEAR